MEGAACVRFQAGKRGAEYRQRFAGEQGIHALATQAESACAQCRNKASSGIGYRAVVESTAGKAQLSRKGGVTVAESTTGKLGSTTATVAESNMQIGLPPEGCFFTLALPLLILTFILRAMGATWQSIRG